jgi:hypothetical protein
VLDDVDFLRVVHAERLAAIGMDEGDDIIAEREQAYQYFKGEMLDVQPMANRSKVVASSVSDAILTALPDLVEIFIGGDNIGAFAPVGEEDTEAAKQETQIVNHVIMNENDGFGIVYDACHDALLAKVGIVHFWAERTEEYEEDSFEGANALMLQAVQQAQDAEITAVEQIGVSPEGEPLFRLEARRKKTTASIKVEVVAPEDFATARDTVCLRDATYCVMRTRPRAQDLIAKGFDEELVARLPSYSALAQETVDLARDVAGEHENTGEVGDSTGNLRLVVVHVHVLRIDADGDGTPEVWRIDTDEADSVVLQKQKLHCVPFAGGTPYRQPHRFYGRSLADLCLELQRVQTALLRMAMDAGYFALNQRGEVAMDRVSEHTIGDLLTNIPGMPVRSRTGDAVRPLQFGGLSFDPYKAMEYIATVGEQRTGIVRNAQGLNPDTLHDTAKGAMALMTLAQKRVRMIARSLAETLFKDLFLGVHALLRAHGGQQMAARLGNKWVAYNPTSWNVRKDFTAEIGMGAGGKDHDMMMAEANWATMMQVIQLQGGPVGPVVTMEGVYAAAQRKAMVAGIKTPELYYTDPKTVPPQPPQPDPKAVLEEKKQQQAAQEAQAKMQLDMQKAMAEMQLKITEMQGKMQVERERNAAEERIAMYTARERARIAEMDAILDAENDRDDGGNQGIPRYRNGGALDR